MTIRNDATRLRIISSDERQPRSVVSRQGQVLLDTDFDEQSRYVLHRIETDTVDTFGEPGRFVVPAGDSGFSIATNGADPANLDIGSGHGYLGGWLLENAATCKLINQPHPWAAQAAGPFPANGIVALKALIRHVDPVEDKVLADSALGDALGSGRSLVDWQVFPVQPTGAVKNCDDVLADKSWADLVVRSTGTIGVASAADGLDVDVCSLTPSGGYTRHQNLLYRIEVHGGEAVAQLPDGPRFGLKGLQLKLSRRNASLMVEITAVNGTELSVSPPALDLRNWFAPGAYAEIVSPHDDLDPRTALAKPRLFAVAQSRDDRVTLAATAAEITATGVTTGPGQRWFLRLWDAFPDAVNGLTAVGAGDATGLAPALDLGDGLSLVVGGGNAARFRRGDYWTFTARADGTIDWPLDGLGGQQQRPHGPETRYAPLGFLDNLGKFADCRIPFAALTDRTLEYRGGDGQSAFPITPADFVILPGRLRVAVMRGKTPVAGARLRWLAHGNSPASRIDGNNCATAVEVITETGSDGLSAVNWQIDSHFPDAVHRVEVWLLEKGKPAPPPLVFLATFNNARTVGYTPGDCDRLQGVTNVQDALEVLCKADASPPKLPVVVKTNWRNDSVMQVDELLRDGLGVVFSEPIDEFSQQVDGIFILELEVSRHVEGALRIGGDGWIRERVIVPGDVKWPDQTEVIFYPTFNGNSTQPGNPAAVLHSIVDQLFYTIPAYDRVIRARVTLKGHGFLGQERGPRGMPRALNGNVLLAPADDAHILDFARDENGLIWTADSLGPHNFESWFYLTDNQ